MKYGCIFQNRRVWWDGAGCGSGSTVWVWSDEESTIGPLLLLRAMWEASGEALRAGRVRVRPQDGGAPLQEALGSLQMPLLGGAVASRSGGCLQPPGSKLLRVGLTTCTDGPGSDRLSAHPCDGQSPPPGSLPPFGQGTGPLEAHALRMLGARRWESPAAQ